MTWNDGVRNALLWEGRGRKQIMSYIKRDCLAIYWSDLLNSRLVSARTAGLQVQKARRPRSASERFPFNDLESR
jgi:hypothetical protein